MAKAKVQLRTRSAIQAELEKIYESLTAPGADWDMDDRQFLEMQIKVLVTAMNMAGDEDVAARITALQERFDEISGKNKPSGTVTPIRA